MQNRSLFVLDPAEKNLMNDGVVEVNTQRNSQGLAIIRYELKTFVCEGQYEQGLRRILDSYLRNFGSGQQPAAWVSGFYGSGKSHLIKMLGYYWEDFKFPDGTTARSIKNLPAPIQDALAELNLKQKKYGQHVIFGTLNDFPADNVHTSFLELLLNSLDLPAKYHHFRFLHWLKEEGIAEQVQQQVESQGKDFVKEYQNLFVSDAIAAALFELKPDFAPNKQTIRQLLKENFPRVTKIDRPTFVRAIREEILPYRFGDELPCMAIILDEVQHFMQEDADRATEVQFLAEDLSKKFDGRFLLIGAGQNALRDTPILQKIMDRFTLSVNLSDTDVETVTRKTVLEKKPSALADLEKNLENRLGEIARLLHGTQYAYTSQDQSLLAADYPILPPIRNFWKKLLRTIDRAGTSALLRSQLRIVDESIKSVAEQPVGAVVSGDFIFEQKKGQLLNTGDLLNETSNLIEELKKDPETLLAGRVLSMVFLLDQIPPDIEGNRLAATPSAIADLLIDDLNQSSDRFRREVQEQLDWLMEEKKALTLIGDEYKLQTKVGAAWEKAFAQQSTRLKNDGANEIFARRREEMLTHLQQLTQSIQITQGEAHIPRRFQLVTGDHRPDTSSVLNLWLKDGWMENEATLLDEIRQEGNDSALVYLYVPRRKDKELQTEIIRYLAAEATLAAQGTPSDAEGQQALKSMRTRRDTAARRLKELSEQITREAKVYLAGGSQVDEGNLTDSIRSALDKIALRQFSDYHQADAKNWEKVLRKALSNDPHALEQLPYQGTPHEHPVGKALLRFIGGGSKKGQDIRQQFMQAPYGWSQDAIDAMLVLLTLSEHLSTIETNLNQRSLKSADFKQETYTLSVKDKIQLRKLFQQAGISTASGQEALKASEFLAHLIRLAEQVSGDEPLPEPISTQYLKDLSYLDGNHRLTEMVKAQERLKQDLSTWTQQVELVHNRLPQWRLLADLLPLCPEGEATQAIQQEAQAIRQERLLLRDPDPVARPLEQLVDHLREQLNQRKQSYNQVHQEQMDQLQADPIFAALSPEDKNRLLREHDLLHQVELQALDAHKLLSQLQHRSLSGWDDRIRALPGRFQEAIQEAIELAQPKTQFFPLPKRTLESKADLESYLNDLRKKLGDLLDQGPVRLQ